VPFEPEDTVYRVVGVAASIMAPVAAGSAWLPASHVGARLIEDNNLRELQVIGRRCTNNNETNMRIGQL